MARKSFMPKFGLKIWETIFFRDLNTPPGPFKGPWFLANFLKSEAPSLFFKVLRCATGIPN